MRLEQQKEQGTRLAAVDSALDTPEKDEREQTALLPSKNKSNHVWGVPGPGRMAWGTTILHQAIAWCGEHPNPWEGGLRPRKGLCA